MKKLMKLTALCMTFILAGLIPAEPAAASEITIRPMYAEIDIFVNSFEIYPDGNASVYTSVHAGNADSTSVGVYLEKNNNGTWSSVKSWSGSSNSVFSNAGGTYYVTHGQYRIRSYCSVYINGSLADYDSYVSYTITY